MAGSFHFYFDAATALWRTPLKQLSETAKDGEPVALRRAAEATLRVKNRYMTPEMFTSERAAITQLASTLSNDPEFTLDLALKLGRPFSEDAGAKGGKRSPQRSRLTARPEARRWRVALWVAVTAAAFLLILDVLATAGVPVPTPIGQMIDRFGGTEEGGTVPLPVGPDSQGGGDRGVPGLDPAAGPGDTFKASASLRPMAAWNEPADTKTATRRADAGARNPNYANGKERNQANGRLRNGVEEPIGGPPPDRGRPADAGPPEEKGRPRHARPPQHAGDARNERAGTPAGP